MLAHSDTQQLGCDSRTCFLVISSLTQTLNHSVTQSLSHSVTQSLSHSVTQSLSHSVTQSLSHSVTQSLSHLVSVGLPHLLGFSSSPGIFFTCSDMLLVRTVTNPLPSIKLTATQELKTQSRGNPVFGRLFMNVFLCSSRLPHSCSESLLLCVNCFVV